MRKDLYSMKLLLTLFLSYVCLQTASLAQAPILLSSEGAPLIFELPLDASTTQSLSANTAIRLATPAQHTAQGMVYPEWLSDASFSVKNRPGQRLGIVVTPKRGNPELSTELLLTFNNAGRRSFRPLHLMFDTLSRFAGEPLPAATASATPNPTDDKPNLTAQSAPVISFPASPVATSTPIPEQLQAPSTNTSLASAGHQPKSNSSLRARSPSASIGMTPVPTAPVPANAISMPTLPATPPMPARNAKPLPAPSPASPYDLDSWLQNWPTLAGGLALLLALLYLVKRALKGWRERRGNQLPTTFLEPKPTALAPEESGANTVFGVSEEEANAMHAKWLREQTTKRL